MENINLAAQLGIVKGKGAFEPFLPITSQDADEILTNTKQLLGIRNSTGNRKTDVLDFDTKDLEGTVSDSADTCTIEQSIAAFWQLYQSATA